MPAETRPWDAWKARLDEAVDFARSHGLIKLSPEGGVVHAPFTLVPLPIAPALNDRLAALTAPFNRLAGNVARDADFLREALAPVARQDAFLRRLLGLAGAGARAQPLRLAVTRADYFLRAREGERPPQPVQVELNTVAVSYPALAERVSLLHRYLVAGTPAAERSLPDAPLAPIAEGFAAAAARLGKGSLVAMVVQPGERNLFDQRLLEFALREYGLAVRRVTLEQIGAEGALRRGDLALEGEVVAVAYLRAGYAPEDYATEAAWRGRELIEHSSAIAVPDVAVQLAGSKKIQQVLADPGVLGRFCAAEEAALLAATFAGLHDPEATIAREGDRLPAWRAALAHPDRFVLKPQREGGGHNLFDGELARFLAESTPASRAPFILMERIRPAPRPTLMVKEGLLREGLGVSEIGRFGVFLAHGDEILVNRDAGYLVRTKPAESQEGGISAGYGYLDSLILEGDEAE